MNALWIFALIAFCIFLGYCIGIYRAHKTYQPSKYKYDEGYLEGYNDAVKELTREDNAREVINQIEDLFGEEDDIHAE